MGFNASNFAVCAAGMQFDGVLLGGRLTQLNGTMRNGMGRLNADFLPRLSSTSHRRIPL